MNHAKGQISLDPDDYEDTDIADADNPELTAEDFARAKPAREVLGDGFVDAWTKAQTSPSGVAAHLVTEAQPHLSALVIAFYRAQGADWEARLNADMEDLVRIKQRG